MPTRNVNLTDELDTFVLAKVESGRYENASEVVRAALRTLEREERHYETKLAALRMAIDEGDHSGVAEGNPFDRVRRTLKLTGKRRVPKKAHRRWNEGPYRNRKGNLAVQEIKTDRMRCVGGVYVGEHSHPHCWYANNVRGDDTSLSPVWLIGHPVHFKRYVLTRTKHNLLGWMWGRSDDAISLRDSGCEIRNGLI